MQVRDALQRVMSFHAAVSDLIATPAVRDGMDERTCALVALIVRQQSEVQEGIYRFVDAPESAGVLHTYIQNLPGDELPETAIPDASIVTPANLGGHVLALYRPATRLCRQLASGGLPPVAARLFDDLAARLEAMGRRLSLALVLREDGPETDQVASRSGTW
jgi:hypothetical protein